MRVIAGFVFAAIVGVAAAAPLKAVPPELVSVKKSGGRTIHGLYRSAFSVKSDGTVIVDGAPRGKLAASSLKSLKTRIARTDFAKIKSKKFGGVRPSAYDGVDVIYIFSTPNGKSTIENYRYVIDPTLPLFNDLEELMRTYSKA